MIVPLLHEIYADVVVGIAKLGIELDGAVAFFDRLGITAQEG